MADRRQADDRQGALTKAACQQDQQEQIPHKGRCLSEPTHQEHHDAEAEQVEREHSPRAEPIEQPAAGQAEGRAQQRGPQVDGRVGDLIQLQIGEKRLGDQAQAVRASGQRGDHGSGRHQGRHRPAG